MSPFHFNLGAEFAEMFGTEPILPPKSLSIIGYPEHWKAQKVIDELLRRAQAHHPGKIDIGIYGEDEMRHLHRVDYWASEAKSGKQAFIFDGAELGANGRKLDVQVMSRYLRNLAMRLDVPVLLLLPVRCLLRSDPDHPYVAEYRIPPGINYSANLELFVSDGPQAEVGHSWTIKRGKYYMTRVADPGVYLTTLQFAGPAVA